jgi:hypothetical protein
MTKDSAAAGVGAGAPRLEEDDWLLPDDDDDPLDPVCADCGCDLFTEEHDWNCGYAGEDDERDDEI